MVSASRFGISFMRSNRWSGLNKLGVPPPKKMDVKFPEASQLTLSQKFVLVLQVDGKHQISALIRACSTDGS